MLFPYPAAATADNWLHDVVLAAVKAVHKLVDDGEPMPEWPNILMVDYRDKLLGRSGLAERFITYEQAVRALDPAGRQLLFNAIDAQNKISALLAGQCDCAELAELPAGTREPAKALFTFAFELLTSFEIRQRQYELLCKVIPARICPFCGCEGLDAPGAPQEDLDHYIPRSKYPFAAANLRNLAPMGGRCNSAYKKTQDPLRRATGERRLAIDPFDTQGISVSLDNSIVDEETAGPIISAWVIDLLPSGEAVDTWNEIFHIRERWTRDVLDERTFMQWLGDFRNYCMTAALQFTGDNDVMDAVQRYEQYLTGQGFRDRAFLKAAVFRFLVRRCAAGCQRLLPILRDLTGSPPPPALMQDPY
ncbi:hypothetical protein [Variovorax sp. 160MFSha2.1]|uniref:hypothetical protein n=1 Tax=Variovorax sp. 160MFSha2.1 TaxID=3158367 RepID=UPI003AACB50D